MQVENYVGKISGPLLDRITIHIVARPVDIETGEPIVASSERGNARPGGVGREAAQERRFAGMNGVDCNARNTEKMFASMCPMEASA